MTRFHLWFAENQQQIIELMESEHYLVHTITSAYCHRYYEQQRSAVDGIVELT